MLCGLAQFYAGKGFALKVLAQKVMPDHVHLVIQVLEPLPQSIGAVVRGFKSGCTKVYKEMYGSGENAAGVHGNGEGKAPVQFVRIFAGRGSIWQQDAAYYHERILHAPGQLRRMIDYVKDNGRRRQGCRLHRWATISS
jgi:REP element-mobilizing transposase RayT